MIQGETPTFHLSFPFDIAGKDFEICIGQRDKILRYIGCGDCEAENNNVSFALDLETSRKLTETANLQLQAVIFNDDGTTVKSIIAEEPVYKAVQP